MVSPQFAKGREAVLDQGSGVWRLSAGGAEEEVAVPEAEMLKAWRATLVARVALGFGRIAASYIDAPNVFVNLV